MLKQNKLKILIVGYKSFIQTNLYKFLKKKFFVKKIKFSDLNLENTHKFDFIINCSNSKNFFDKRYSKNTDRNLKIANIINNTKAKLIMLSTRQVYKQKFFLTEKSKLDPVNQYGRNCLKSEKYCKGVLNDKLIILRLSNIFGFENGIKKKPSLVSLIIKGLKKKEILFDNNYYLYKDFLPIQTLCIYIEKLINLNVKGIFNIGSGIPILVKDFINAIIGLEKIKIKIKIKKNFKDKNYSFNINKTKKMTKVKISKKDLYFYLFKLKKKLNIYV